MVHFLLPYLWPKGRLDLQARVLLALGALFLAKLANTGVPLLYKQAIDVLSGDQPGILEVPIALIVGYGLARVAAIGFGELRDAIFAKVGQSAIRAVGLQVFRHLHQLSLRFHLERKTGGLSRSVDRGVRAIELLIRFMLFLIIPTLLEILMVVGILVYLFDWWFALTTFVTVAGYLTFTFLITEWRTTFRRQMNESESRASTRTVESLINYETVKYFGKEEHEARRYDEVLRDYERVAILNQTSLSLLNAGQAAIIAGGLALIMLLAANGIVDGSMGLGDFVLVNTYLIQLYLPLNFLGFAYREVKQAIVDIEDMFALLTIQHEVLDKPGARPLAVSGGEINFENVWFSYEPRRTIIKGISFKVPSGQTVAVVGPSGAGKSTLGRLLFRFYNIDQGRILIDGQDIQSISQRSLRAAIGIVPQDTVLFSDTIAYNIGFGHPAIASTQSINQAAQAAQIHDFILSLPDKYDSMVGERGVKLSGGERQRVAIARAILKNAPIALFDEATSALDTHTEQAIQAQLREVSQGRTTLVIAHRLSTIVDADQILVMVDGAIIEQGQHNDLLARDGVYAAMWHRQANEPDHIAKPEPVLAM